jgi:hypothetical protein
MFLLAHVQDTLPVCRPDKIIICRPESSDRSGANKKKSGGRKAAGLESFCSSWT